MERILINARLLGIQQEIRRGQLKIREGLHYNTDIDLEDGINRDLAIITAHDLIITGQRQVVEGLRNFISTIEKRRRLPIETDLNEESRRKLSKQEAEIALNKTSIKERSDIIIQETVVLYDAGEPMEDDGTDVANDADSTSNASESTESQDATDQSVPAQDEEQPTEEQPDADVFPDQEQLAYAVNDENLADEEQLTYAVNDENLPDEEQPDAVNDEYLSDEEQHDAVNDEEQPAEDQPAAEDHPDLEEQEAWLRASYWGIQQSQLETIESQAGLVASYEELADTQERFTQIR